MASWGTRLARGLFPRKAPCRAPRGQRRRSAVSSVVVVGPADVLVQRQRRLRQPRALRIEAVLQNRLHALYEKAFTFTARAHAASMRASS